MRLTEKAKELGLELRTLQKRCDSNPGYEGSVKVGREWVFPDKEQSEDAAIDVIPTRDDCGDLKEYFNTLKAREEWLKLRQARSVTSGKLVNRADLEASYRRVFTLVQKSVMALPSKLKNRVGEDLSDRVEQILEGLCEELLHSLADGAQ